MLRTLPPRFKSCLATNQVATSCMTLTSDWIKLRGSHFTHGIYVTCRKTNLPWAGKVRLSTFCNNFLQSATTWFVARQVWFLGGKTCNISFEPVLQQCCKTSKVARICCPFYRTFIQKMFITGYYHMTGTAPRAMSLETHTRQLIGPEKRVRLC